MRLFDFLAPFVPRTRRGVTIRSGAPFPAFSPPSIPRAPRRAPLFSQTIVPADVLAPKNPLSRLVTDPAFQKPGKESEFDRGSLLARAPPERGERHRHRRGTTVGRHRRGCGE